MVKLIDRRKQQAKEEGDMMMYRYLHAARDVLLVGTGVAPSSETAEEVRRSQSKGARVCELTP